MTTSQTIGYFRVSPLAQDFDKFLKILEPYCPDKIFWEVASTRTRDRPELMKMLEYVHEGDSVVIPSMDRLGLDFQDLFSIVKEIQDKGASIRFVQEGVSGRQDSPDPRDKVLIKALALVADFEIEKKREYQREGIEAAKERGVYKGRQPIDPKLLRKGRKLVEKGLSIPKAAEKIGVCRTTLWKHLKDKKEQNESTKKK